MSRARILVAGIGNIFLGDDAFGVEVARQLLQQPMPEGVHVVDFGIRSFDLACSIQDGYEAVILVDTVCRGGPPGTLYVIEPDLPSNAVSECSSGVAGHSLTPGFVLQWLPWLRTDSDSVPRIRIVGCEPAEFGSDENPRMGLSPAVQGAIAQAIQTIHFLIEV